MCVILVKLLSKGLIQGLRCSYAAPPLAVSRIRCVADILCEKRIPNANK